MEGSSKGKSTVSRAQQDGWASGVARTSSTTSNAGGGPETHRITSHHVI